MGFDGEPGGVVDGAHAIAPGGVRLRRARRLVRRFPSARDPPAPTIASTPSASTSLPIATTPSGTAPGDACSPEGATQNADACQKAGGMCAFSTCENGHWAWHEVPPRPNLSTGPTAQPTIPGFPSSPAPADLADGSKPFSIAMWIKPTKSGGTLAHVSANDDGTGWCTPFLGYDASGRIVSQVLHGSGPAPTEFSIVEPRRAAGRRCAAACRDDVGAGAGLNRLYVNGAEVAATAAPTYHARLGRGTTSPSPGEQQHERGRVLLGQGPSTPGTSRARFRGRRSSGTPVMLALTRAERGGAGESEA